MEWFVKKFIKRFDMSYGQVTDVNIVTDTSAIWSWIVAAEYLYFIPTTYRDLK